KVLSGLKAALGDIPIVGGSSVGTITSNQLGYAGFECAVALWPQSLGTPEIVSVSMRDGEDAAGRELGRRMRNAAGNPSSALLFYDSIRSSPPPSLYVGSALTEGIYAELGDKNLTVVGAGQLGDITLSGSVVFNGQEAVKHTAVAVILPQGVHAHSSIMHGCVPLSGFLEITRIEGATIYELDGRPAFEVVKEKLGLTSDKLNNLSLSITFGEKHGDLFGPYDESAYVNRLVIGVDPEKGSFTLFEADFKKGARVQLMSRENNAMLASVKARTQLLRESVAGKKVACGLYVDCAGRARAFSGGEVEEASVLQSSLGEGFPLLGFYSGVEIAPLLGRSRPLDWTGVLTLFTVDGQSTP
ncbi:MAG: FIST C-terminal domain-containing protein, partial [Deltaproteobacteria bacterium]|nr:FIST C-terminal domain-containing protein [Deltaproteobacteria bacterium]